MVIAVISERWKGEGALETKTNQARVRATEEKRRRQEQRLAATVTAVNHGTHTHAVPHFTLAVTAGRNLPLWPGWWQRLKPLSWALLPQRRAHAMQCARALWSGRGESEPVNMTGVPSLTHWLVWHAHVHINVIQTCAHSPHPHPSLPSQPCQHSLSSHPDKILSDTNFNYSPHPNNAMWQELSLL